MFFAKIYNSDHRYIIKTDDGFTKHLRNYRIYPILTDCGSFKTFTDTFLHGRET